MRTKSGKTTGGGDTVGQIPGYYMNLSVPSIEPGLQELYFG